MRKVTFLSGFGLALAMSALAFDASAANDMNTWKLDPAPGKVNQVPAEFLITFPDAGESGIEFTTPSDWKGAQAKITLSTPAGVLHPDFVLEQGRSMGYGNQTGKITFEDGPFLDEGIYVLTIEADTWRSWDSKDLVNPQIVATYTIGDVAPADPFDTYTLDPANGWSGSSISKVSVLFPDAAPINCVGATTVTLTKEGGEPIACNWGDYMSDDNGDTLENGYEFYFDQITEAGTYTLTIPAGVLSDYANPELKNKEITAVYTIEGGSVVSNPFDEWTADPAVGTVTSIPETIKLTFPGLTAINQLQGPNVLNLTDGDKVYSALRVQIQGNEASIILDMYPDTEVKTPGVYTLTIPEGFFGNVEDENVVNAPIVLNYTIEEPYNPMIQWEMTPANGANLEVINQVMISFPGTSAENGGDGVDIENALTKQVELKNLTTGESFGNNGPIDYGANYDFTKAIFHFDNIATEGVYRLTLPAGLFKDHTNAANQSEKIEVYYTIGAEYDVMSYAVLTPESGSKVESISNISLFFPLNDEWAFIYTSENYTPEQITLKNETTGTTVNVAELLALTKPDGSFDFRGFDLRFDEQTADGTYTLTIPAGMFTNDYNQYNKAIEATYTIGEVVADDPFEGAVLLPDPAVAVASIKELKVVFPKIASAEDLTWRDSKIFSIYLSNDSYDSAYCTELTKAETENGLEVTMTFSKELNTNGEYTLTIPAMVFSCNGVDNKKITAVYTVDTNVGVSSILAEGQTADVYDLAGRVVLRNADARALDLLESGIYIINGKKVAVRK